jgi:hypothetical protein
MSTGERATSGFELPLLLFAGFRSVLEELHAELARRGHPDMRPAHGFAMQAIGLGGATATEVGRRLGISEDIRGRWAGALGAERLAEMEECLRVMAPGDTFRLDVPGWFGS